MAVDYDVGRRDLGQLYTNLMNALKNKGTAENERRRKEIEKEGLFGSGIKSDDLRDLANTGMAFAKFGSGRKEVKMSRAKESFERRMDQARSRILELRRFGDQDSISEIRAIQAGMNEERNRFENLMSDYEQMSLLESGLGGKGVGYKGTGEMSSFMEDFMKSKSDRDAKRRATLADESRRQQHQTSYFEPEEGLMNVNPSTFPRRPSGVDEMKKWNEYNRVEGVSRPWNVYDTTA